MIGRRAEIQALFQALDAVAAGRGGIVEIVGDPGIGKSRLLIELAAEAARRGVPVLHGGASEFEHDLPFHVFLAALGERYRQGGGEPRLAALFSGRGVPGSGADRFRVYDAVRDLLTEWARQGLVLLLDDMHWADPGGIELAEYLVRHPPAAPLLLALSLRPRQCPVRLAAALARGAGDGTVHRIRVGGLSLEESAELIGPDVASRALWEQSGGNPLYLLALAARGAAPDPKPRPGSEPEPTWLEAVLLAELDPLADAERRVAQAAAVLGERFHVTELAPVADLSPDEVAAAVGTLVERDLLRADADPARLVFRHPVLRHVVYQGTAPAWRASAHRRALAELTRRGAGVIERAHHVACSTDRAAADLEVLEQAAAVAVSTAPATAAHWLRIALDALPAEQTERRLRILLTLTRALGVAGRLAESRDLLREILRLVPRQPPGPRAAAVAFCATMERLLANYAEASALLRAELAAPRIAASPEGTALAVEYGTVALLRADYPAASEHVAVALDRARRRRDPVREANTLTISAFGEVYEGNTATAADAADAAGALVDRLSDRELSADAECLSKLGWAEVFLERFADADRHFRRGVTLCRHIGHHHVLPHLLLGRCQLAALRGRLAEAMTLSEEAEEIARHIGSADVLGLALAIRSFVASWTDKPAAAVQMAEQAVATIPEDSVWWASVARIHLAGALLPTDPKRALQVLTDAGGGSALPLLQPSRRPSCLDIVTTAAVRIGDLDTAEQAAAGADREAVLLGLAGQRGFALRSHGLLAAMAGRHVEAAASFRAAIDLWESVGMRVAAAVSLVLLAQSTAATGQDDAALALANQAGAVAADMGAGQIHAMAEKVRRSLTGGRDHGPDHGRDHGPDRDPLADLTVREREIARLAATGRTSRDIAAALYLSPRTVDTHLARIYRKLGLSSRTALAALLAAQWSTTR